MEFEEIKEERWQRHGRVISEDISKITNEMRLRLCYIKARFLLFPNLCNTL